MNRLVSMVLEWENATKENKTTSPDLNHPGMKSLLVNVSNERAGHGGLDRPRKGIAAPRLLKQHHHQEPPPPPRAPSLESFQAQQFLPLIASPSRIPSKNRRFLGRYRTASTPDILYRTRSLDSVNPPSFQTKSRCSSLVSLRHRDLSPQAPLFLNLSEKVLFLPKTKHHCAIRTSRLRRPSNHLRRIPVLNPNRIIKMENMANGIEHPLNGFTATVQPADETIVNGAAGATSQPESSSSESVNYVLPPPRFRRGRQGGLLNDLNESTVATHGSDVNGEASRVQESPTPGSNHAQDASGRTRARDNSPIFNARQTSNGIRAPQNSPVSGAAVSNGLDLSRMGTTLPIRSRHLRTIHFDGVGDQSHDQALNGTGIHEPERDGSPHTPDRSIVVRPPSPYPREFSQSSLHSGSSGALESVDENAPSTNFNGGNQMNGERDHTTTALDTDSGYTSRTGRDLERQAMFSKFAAVAETPEEVSDEILPVPPRRRPTSAPVHGSSSDKILREKQTFEGFPPRKQNPPKPVKEEEPWDDRSLWDHLVSCCRARRVRYRNRK